MSDDEETVVEDEADAREVALEGYGFRDGPFPSELVPPETNLDVDISELSKRHHAGERPALVLAGSWVRLGDHEDVPEGYVGHIAAVLESPWSSVPFAGDSKETIHGYRYDKNKLFRVQTRDAANAILSLPQEAFAEIADSRASLLNHA